MRYFFIFFVLYVVSCTTAEAQKIYQLELHNCELEEGEKQRIARGIDAILLMYKAYFDLDVPEQYQFKIKIFDTRENYAKYREKISSANSNIGFYSNRYKEAVTWKKQNFLTTVLHEANHAILHAFFERPRWLQEGIAEYFETIEVDDEKISIDFQPHRDRRCQNWLKKDQLIALDKYFTLLKVQRKGQETKVWTHGWSLVYFLMESKEGRHILKNFIWEMTAEYGEHPNFFNVAWLMIPFNMLAIYERAIPQGVERLNQEWRDWIPKPRKKHVFYIRDLNNRAQTF